MRDVPISAAPFNSALETGVRALAVLAEASPRALDLQELVYFDYLIVHSGDAGGPTSLHPNTPLRNGELLVRRTIIEQGVLLMVSADSRKDCFAMMVSAMPLPMRLSPFLNV